jgi:arginine decarboxylase
MAAQRGRGAELIGLRAAADNEGHQMFPTPKRLFLTKGVGAHRHPLTAFEFALRDANIEQQNLVHVSSIIPPHCELIGRSAGVALLKPGDITFCVMARAETNEAGRHVHANIGLARPADPDMYGYISEHHGFGSNGDLSGEYAEDLAATMLASTLGLDFDPEAAWNERKQIYEHSHVIIDSMSITASAECAADNRWTCAIAAAVFLFS